MATLSLTWKDLNLNEDGFRIYRSETPMDVGAMPSPIATLPANTGSYDDTSGVNGTRYYYRIGVFRGTEEKFSVEFVAIFGDTFSFHDIFGDSSAVATYKFDGNLTDVGGNYDGTWTGTELYSTDAIEQQSASFDGLSTIENTSLPVPASFSASFWVNLDRLDKKWGFCRLVMSI